jgi:hypothetical protein
VGHLEGLFVFEARYARGYMRCKRTVNEEETRTVKFIMINIYLSITVCISPLGAKEVVL